MLDLLLIKPDFKLYNHEHFEEPLNLFLIKSEAGRLIEDFSGLVYTNGSKPRFFKGIKENAQILFKIDEEYYTFSLLDEKIINLLGTVRSTKILSSCRLESIL